MNLTLLGGSASGWNSREFTATKQLPLGTIAYDKFGNRYRYSQAGAADLVVGNLVQSAARVANHLAQTPPAVAVGATSFLFTPGATAGAENLYADGYLQVDTTPGNGEKYGISGHPAIVSATAFLLSLHPDEAIATALTTSSRVGLIHNPYKNVIQTPTTLTARVVGGVVAPITATYYGWIQVRGHFCALINGTPAVNAPVTASVTTAGAADVWTAAAQPTTTLVGYMAQVGVSTKNNMIDLQLD